MYHDELLKPSKHSTTIKSLRRIHFFSFILLTFLCPTVSCVIYGWVCGVRRRVSIYIWRVRLLDFQFTISSLRWYPRV